MLSGKFKGVLISVGISQEGAITLAYCNDEYCDMKMLMSYGYLLSRRDGSIKWSECHQSFGKSLQS